MADDDPTGGRPARQFQADRDLGDPGTTLRRTPSWLSAGIQASSPGARIAARTNSVKSKLIEKRIRPLRQQSANSCVEATLIMWRLSVTLDGPGRRIS